MSRPLRHAIGLAAILVPLAAGAATRNGDTDHPFTQSAVQPNPMFEVYPYLLVGKIYATFATGGQGWCTATVLDRRLVITAGHCLHTTYGPAHGGKYYTNVYFVADPDPTKPAGPYYHWQPAVAADVRVTPQCELNCDTFAPDDVGIVVLRDAGPAAAPRALNQVVGGGQHLTFTTGFNAANQNLTVLGFSRFLDGGNRLQQINAQAATFTGGTQIYVPAELVGNPPGEGDSLLGGGSAGGPWVSNFGEDATRTPARDAFQDPNRNAFVGITGYVGYYSAAGTGFGAPELALYRAMCARAANNCYGGGP